MFSDLITFWLAVVFLVGLPLVVCVVWVVVWRAMIVTYWRHRENQERAAAFNEGGAARSAKEAHDLACVAFTKSPEVHGLLAMYGHRISYDVEAPSEECSRYWIVSVNASFGSATNQGVERLAYCMVEPGSGRCEVVVERLDS